MKVFVTGIGAVSAIGLNVAENLQALKSGSTGINRDNDYGLMLGKVRLSNAQIREILQLPDEGYSRTTLLAILASKEAWGKQKKHENIRTGLIAATSIGGLDQTEQLYFEAQKNGNVGPNQKMTFDNGGTTEKLAAAMGITGFIGTISTACSSGANAIMHGARLLEGNKLDRVLVGGADPLALFNIKGFSSLNIYDQDLCRPFDDNRKGLNMGEGAGFLVLENEHSLSITGSRPLCLVAGWNNASDAYHQTASSPDGTGATLAMINALAKANIAPSKISYVNAHGTGTGNNDLSESKALKTVFAPIPPFSSTKSFTGHTLAAAGAIEAVFCVQAIQEQAFLPNLNFSNAMSETGMIPQVAFRSGVTVDFVLSNSFGFGGNCTCLIFSKIQ